MRKALLLCVLVCAVAAGCKSGPSLTGTWTGSGNFSGIQAELEQTFDDSGNISITTKMKNPLDQKDITVTMKGNYSMKGSDKVEAELKSYTFTGLTPAMEGAFKTEMDKQLNKKQTIGLEWVDNDTITWKENTGTYTFKRKK